MALNKKLIRFETEAEYLRRRDNGEILPTSIVFVLDKGYIVTKGKTIGKASASGGEPVDTIVNSEPTTLSNSDWIDACVVNTLDTGTYALQISGYNILASGVFSVLKNSSDSLSDEILMHLMGTGSPVFARTSGTKLQVASTAAGEQTLTIKIKKLI